MNSGIALALLAAALWGLAPVATKGALDGYSPELISVLRLAVAAIVLHRLGGPGTPWLPRERWSWIGGAALGIDFILYNYGLQLTSASVSGLVINVEVVSTIAFAVWLLGERLNRRRLLGSCVTMAGVVYVSGAGTSLADLTAGEHLLGNVMVMLAGICWSLFAVAQRRAPRRRNLFRLLAPIFTVSTLTTTPPLLWRGTWNNPAGLVPTLMLLMLVALCTIAVYVLYARCQELVDVSALAIVLATIPIFAVCFAWLILGEPVNAPIVAGGAVILAGVLVIATERPAGAVIEAAAVERAP
jgi:O-acetylserine/cysteine efflux transporter